jgi:hypothetical protein
VDSHYDHVTEIARCQMKSVQSGAQAPKWKAYKDRYGMQTNQIIEGFTVYEGMENYVEQDARPNTKKKATGKKKGPGTPADKDAVGEPVTPTILKQETGMFTGAAGIAANRKMGATSIVNGLGYEHPHADAGRPDSYRGMKIFPFVTIHTWIGGGCLFHVAALGPFQQHEQIYMDSCIRLGLIRFC